MLGDGVHLSPDGHQFAYESLVRSIYDFHPDFHVEVPHTLSVTIPQPHDRCHSLRAALDRPHTRFLSSRCRAVGVDNFGCSCLAKTAASGIGSNDRALS